MVEKDVSILISGAGAAAGIGAIKSLRLANFSGKITAIDSSDYSAGFYLADRNYVVPRARNPKYIGRLFEIVEEERINLIIPTSGFDIFPISKHASELNKKGVVVFMSDYSTMLLCSDKYQAAMKVSAFSPIPKHYKTIRQVKEYPVFIKPLKGKGSINCYVCKSRREVEAYQRLVGDNFIIQEHLPGKEYTVDLLSDFNRKVVVAVPRLRIRTESGISTTGKVLLDPNLSSLAKKICHFIGIIGPACIQFKEDRRRQVKFTEINPRLGGGSIISTIAGVNIPRLLIDLFLNRSFPTPKFQEVLVTRYLEEKSLN